jgi:hypothetical protein
MYVAEAGIHRQNEDTLRTKYGDSIPDAESFARSDQWYLTVK